MAGSLLLPELGIVNCLGRILAFLVLFAMFVFLFHWIDTSGIEDPAVASADSSEFDPKAFELTERETGVRPQRAMDDDWGER